MSTPPAGPSRAGYWIGGGIIAAGILGALLCGGLAYTAFIHRVDGFQRVPLTGTEVLHLDPGGYVVYYEGLGVPGNVPATTVVVTPSGGLQPLDISRYGGPDGRSYLTYGVHGHAGEAIATFTIPDPGGDYRLTSAAVGLGGLAVGRSIGPQLAFGILGALASAGVGLAIGLLLIILTAVKRRKARRLQAGYAYPGYGYPPYGYAPYGGYQYPPGYGYPGYPGQAPPGPPGPPGSPGAGGHQPAPAPEYVWPDPYPQGPNPEHVHAPAAEHPPIPDPAPNSGPGPVPRPGPVPEGGPAPRG